MLERAGLGELDYFLAGAGLYEATFFLPVVVESVGFTVTNNSL